MCFFITVFLILIFICENPKFLSRVTSIFLFLNVNFHSVWAFKSLNNQIDLRNFHNCILSLINNNVLDYMANAISL